MMKRVSLSQIKTNIVGRRQSSENIPNENGGCESVPVRLSHDDSDEIFQGSSSEVILSKKGLCKGNNIFSALRYKWNKKRVTKTDESNTRSDAGKLTSNVESQDSLSKKLRSKLPKYSSAKRAVCPMPPTVCSLSATMTEQQENYGKLETPHTSAAENNNDLSVSDSLNNNGSGAMSEQLSSHEVMNHIVNLNINIHDSVVLDNATSSFENTIAAGQRPGSLTRELFKLSRCGWYWGPITRSEAEEKLNDQPDGAFLVRDSSDDRYILSLSFRSCSNTLHTRIEHSNGLFSFYAVQHQPHFILNCTENSGASNQHQDPEGRVSIVALIEESMSYSQSGVFCYSRGRTPDSPSYPVRLTKPVSRFNQVRTLQYLCRFVIRQITRFDHIQKLPLPNPIKGYLEESHY